MSIYSSNTIRWTNGPYANKEQAEKSISNLNDISVWWKNQENQKFNLYHILEYEPVFNRDTLQVIWQPVKHEKLGETIISTPNLETKDNLILLSYSNQHNNTKSIETYSIDLDIDRNNLFVWFGNPQQVIIFEKS